jgi:DNA-binding beta-propeller fold protein YncE
LGVLRPIALACVGALGVALAVVAAACSEHFPPTIAATDDAGPVDGGQLEPEPPAIIAPAQRLNASSSPVVFDPLRGGVWTANGDVGTISYVDPDTRTLVQEVPIGQDIRSIALSPDFVWIAAVDRGGGTVTLVDAYSLAIVRAIPVGSHPRACVWDSANPRWLYVSVEDDAVVVVVDRTLGQVVDSIPVLRVPAGLAVSATLTEVYVAHRIDADVTIIDLSRRAVSADVTLADEPFTAPLVPNGKPFGEESLALVANGARAWIPHELLARTQPIVFNQTLFPAVSVIDVVEQTEVITNPASPNIDGRKNLFDAINLIGPDGQPEVFSQLCAIAMHPNGFIAWAVACGSEDLLTFDVNQGIATDVVRNLPGDHPVGLTLDDTGQRVFVMDDQSHTLVTLDTDDGSLIGHTQLYGDPITLVGADPVDPQLRAGYTLFFRANATKGPLTTTDDDWMSCGGCHLDGFGSTNLRLFEAREPADPSQDGQIGHVGLSDNFSTAATPTASDFNPHDVLVALSDQGGLVPVDVDGGEPDGGGGAVEPSAPTPTAVQMAQQIAEVVAHDLPAHPTWAQQSGSAPNLAWDAEFCGECHQAEYAAWKTSVHSTAGKDPMMLYSNGVERGLAGQGIGRLCVGCHDPVGARTGDFSFGTGRGVTCIGCHDVQLQVQAGGNGDLQAAAHDWTQDHKTWALASLQQLREPTFCGGCHQQFVPGTGLIAFSTLDEYTSGPFDGNTLCVDCHMPKTAGIADHHAAGGNVYLAQSVIEDSTLLTLQTAHLNATLTLVPQHVSGGVLVTLHNTGAGHSFPTGVTDIKQAWLQIEALDGSGNNLATYGGLDAQGLVPSNAARLGIDIAQADGTVLLRHELTETTRIPYDVRVPSGEAQALFVPVPDTLPTGTAELDAVVIFGVVRTTYYRDAVGNPDAPGPSIEMARVKVP